MSAINWAVDKEAHIINVSAGFDRQFWFYNPCKGTCRICKAAEKAAGKVFAFYASAGNNGRTVCPARSGVYNPDSKVIAVGSSNAATGEKEKWSGIGNIYSPGTINFQSIKKTRSNESRLALIEKMMFSVWENKEYEKLYHI
ncbi:MAG: S8/S53 family peptidase [Haliscomenobacter sp.]|nr:S8/S53 family peptidase [Haliscomenobacter sp.]